MCYKMATSMKNERPCQEDAEPHSARTKMEQAELAALDQKLAEVRKDYWDFPDP